MYSVVELLTDVLVATPQLFSNILIYDKLDLTWIMFSITDCRDNFSDICTLHFIIYIKNDNHINY